MPTVRSSLLFALIVSLAGLLPHVAIADSILGDWVLNQELSRELQPANANQKKKILGGLGSSGVVVGGVPIPIPGSGGTSAVSTGQVKDPQVLRCEKLTIELAGNDILFTFVGFGTELLKQGNVRGTRTSYKSSKLTSRYETTSRKVSKTYELTKEGRLHATVKLNPNKGKTLVYHRIFDRAS